MTAALAGVLATWLTGFFTPLLPAPELVWITIENIWEKSSTNSNSSVNGDLAGSADDAVYEDILANVIARGCDIELLTETISSIPDQEHDDLVDAASVRKFMDDLLAQAGCKRQDLNEIFGAEDFTNDPILAYFAGEFTPTVRGF